jgi:hypothetical protein
MAKGQPPSRSSTSIWLNGEKPIAQVCGEVPSPYSPMSTLDRDVCMQFSLSISLTSLYKWKPELVRFDKETLYGVLQEAITHEFHVAGVDRWLEESEAIVVGDVTSTAARRRLLVALLAAAPPPLPVGAAGCHGRSTCRR